MFFIYVKDFLDNMRIELKSERTIQTYKESLNAFRLYLRQVHGRQVDEITFEYVTEDTIRRFTSWVAENNSIGTRNIRLSAIKSYLQYAADRDIELIPLQLKTAKIKHKKTYPKKHNWLDKDLPFFDWGAPRRVPPHKAERHHNGGKISLCHGHREREPKTHYPSFG